MSLHEYQLRLLSINAVAQSILQEFLVNASEEILAQSSNIAHPNQSALSFVLSPHIKIFEKDAILKIPNNKSKVFGKRGTNNTINNPDVSTFDVSMICAILKRIPDFDTHSPDKVNPCVNACVQKCCQTCNHKNGNCNSCSESFIECRFNRNLCCSKCQTCGYCQLKNPSCDVFKLKKSLDIIRRARNTAAHGNIDIFTKLEQNGTPLEDFPKCKSWLGLSTTLTNAVFDVLSYMENPQRFLSSKKYIPLQQKNDYEFEMKIACESSPVIVERHFNNVIYKLVTQMQECSEGLTILTDIQGVLSDQVNCLNEVNKKMVKNQDELKDLLNTNQRNVTDGITKILDTLNEKLQNDIQIQGKEQIKVIERINGVEEDIVVDKNKRMKLKKEVDEEFAALKENQIDVKKPVDIPYLREEFEDKSTNQNLLDEKNQVFSPNNIQRLDELITDDGSSHSLKMKESDWYLCCHHDQSNQPEILLNSFDRSKYSPGDKKVLKIYQCGDTKYENEAGYMKYLNDKFDEQFGKDLIQQPWLLTNLHEDCVENRNFYLLCKDVNSFCQNKKYSFLLIDVSIEDNLKNLGFDINIVKEQLKIHDAEDPANRIMVYIGENDIILNIRYIDSHIEKDISDAVRKGQNDTKLFCSLHQDILQKSSISFVSIVITNTTNKNLLEIKTCSRCVSENLIISNRELHTSLESIVQRREKRKVNPSSSASIESTFISLASRLWGTLCIRDVHLPNLCTDHDSALERIYLNGAQRRFLHSRKKHILLRGGYGSGKSVCAQEKFKYLIQNAKTTEDIFYLCFNDDTLFKSVLKQQIKETVNHQLRPEQVSIMNAEEYGMQFGLLPPYMFSEILQDINERSKQTSNKPHVIADEYDSSYLTYKEANDLGRNLKEMKDSYVLLIPQSLETVRKGVQTKRFKKHGAKYEGQEFELTGMTITVLDSIMRNTNSINELLQSVN